MKNYYGMTQERILVKILYLFLQNERGIKYSRDKKWEEERGNTKNHKKKNDFKKRPSGRLLRFALT